MSKNSELEIAKMHTAMLEDVAEIIAEAKQVQKVLREKKGDYTNRDLEVLVRGISSLEIMLRAHLYGIRSLRI